MFALLRCCKDLPSRVCAVAEDIDLLKHEALFYDAEGNRHDEITVAGAVMLLMDFKWGPERDRPGQFLYPLGDGHYWHIQFTRLLHAGG